MYELRVLSGLHRGATLPLDDHPHVIGASDDADVVLVDPGIEEKHASLSLTEFGWSLSALDGGLSTADSNQPQTSIELEPGEFARLGGIWLTVVEQDARWEDPPPEPVDVAVEEDISGEISVADLEDEIDESAMAAVDVAGADDIAAHASDAVHAGDARHEKGRGLLRGLRGRRIVYVPLAVATVLSAAAAYAITSKPESALSSRKIAEHAQIGSRQKTSGKPADKTVAAAFDASNSGGTSERPLTGDELRNAFRKRLADSDLIRRFDLSLLNEQWTMQAALDDEEAARFERILTGFIKQHNITFPIHAKVGNSESMLPFKIRQVISGSNASVVTQEGDRLYVGEEYRGVRLVAIQGNQLTFAGKRKIEVKW
jgi:type III secretion protein D